MRDFGWHEELWAVVKETGTFAGVPCTSYEEARDLSAQHEGSQIFLLIHEDEVKEAELEEWDDCDNDCGFDPYLGCFTDDC
jgi:hypothetical protein